METENSSSNGSGSKVKADNTPVLCQLKPNLIS